METYFTSQAARVAFEAAKKMAEYLGREDMTSIVVAERIGMHCVYFSGHPTCFCCVISMKESDFVDRMKQSFSFEPT